MMQFTKLWTGGPEYKSGERVFPLTTDSILLADFAPSERVKNVLDIGCGSGIIGLLVAWKNENAHVTGVDISHEAVTCATENIVRNTLERRFCVVCCDIMNAPLKERSFDLVVCNPPYIEKGRGNAAGTEREESSATLLDIITRAASLLRIGGSLCIVIRPDRLNKTLRDMGQTDFSPKRLRFVLHTKSHAPSMALIDARYRTECALESLPQLILKDENGGDSAEIRRIYHMED